MKLHLAPGAGLHLFTGYGTDYVSVNNVRYTHCVLVAPDGVKEWTVPGFDALTGSDFGFVEEQKPEIVIFGTGSAQRFPAPPLARALAASGAGVEVMNSAAACRTYNILASEGRKVVAAILVGR